LQPRKEPLAVDVGATQYLGDEPLLEGEKHENCVLGGERMLMEPLRLLANPEEGHAARFVLR
jgi:hypothetical protein